MNIYEKLWKTYISIPHAGNQWRHKIPGTFAYGAVHGEMTAANFFQENVNYMTSAAAVQWTLNTKVHSIYSYTLQLYILYIYLYIVHYVYVLRMFVYMTVQCASTKF